MKPAESRWARYTRAAMAGTEEERIAVGEPGPPGPPGRRRTKAWRVLQTLFSRLTRDPERALPFQPQPRADLRLTPTVVAVWAGAAIAIGLPWNYSLVWAGGSVGLAVAVLWVLHVRRNQKTPPAKSNKSTRFGTSYLWEGILAAILLATICLGTLLVGVTLRQFHRQHDPLVVAVLQGEDLVLTMQLSSIPRRVESEYGASRVIFDAVVLEATSKGRSYSGRLPTRVIADERWEQVPQGAQVGTAGRIRPAALSDKVAGFLTPGTVPLNIVPMASDAPALLRSSWKVAVREVWAGVSSDTTGLLPGMVTGDRSGVDSTLGESMKTVGLTHLTAVSGTNCTLVVAALLLVVRSLHVNRRVAAAVSILGLGAFVMIVGPDPSVLRAALMGVIGALAMLGGRPKRVGALLSASIVVLLVWDPWLATDYAFALSVSATLGLHLVGQRCARWLGSWMPGWLAQAVAIPLAAQLFCAPIIVMLQARLTLYTVPANMAVAPVVALVTIVGTLGMCLGPIAPVLAQGCAGVSGIGAGWVAAVSRLMSSLPAASLPWPEGFGGVTLMAVLNAAVLLVLLAVVEPERAKGVFESVRQLLPARYRFVLGFFPLTTVAASGAALITLGVLSQ